MTATKDKTYIQAIGRRKTATAQVRITETTRSKIVVNDKDLAEYFPTDDLQKTIQDALVKAKDSGTFSVSALVKGGGKRAQAEAVRLGISRALVKHDEELRSPLKKLGYLKRDPRKKERKKFGLKKARKAAQWSKR